ncbi:hypothetical protein ACGFNX_10660 [Streptomyces sp. NPDC048723]|uniref:hypothetical protein n=1 Tax=Streptomyces sp. NPDC048723 TaxID=3365589 RepID=UPI00371A79F3
MAADRVFGPGRERLFQNSGTAARPRCPAHSMPSETVEKAEPAAEPTGVVDVMEALRAGVERAGSSPKATGGKATASGKPSAEKKPGAKTRIRSAPKEDLSRLSKADFYKKAAAADVSGRSQMIPDDLVKALSSSRT